MCPGSIPVTNPSRLTIACGLVRRKVRHTSKGGDKRKKGRKSRALAKRTRRRPMATSSASPPAPPPSPAAPPPLAIRDGAARDRDGAAMPLGGDRLQNDTPPMLLGSPPLAPRDGSAMQPGGGQLEMDEMDEEGRTRHHARMCAAPLPLPPHPTAAVSRNEEAGLNRQPAPLRVGPSVRVLSTKDRVYLSKRPPQPSPGPSLRPRVFMLTCGAHRGARVQAEQRARARLSQGSDARQSGDGRDG